MSELFGLNLNLLHENKFLGALVLCALAFLLAGTLKLFLNIAAKRLKVMAERTEGKWDDLIVEMLFEIKFLVVFIWMLNLLAHAYGVSGKLQNTLEYIVILASIGQVGFWGFSLIKYWRSEFLDKKMSQDTSSAAALGLVYIFVQIMFILTLALIGLSNLGVDIGALLAGLGVGGIAVALAAQNVLGDLLASLSIVLDKPFIIGDFIEVGTEKGTVVHIGIKTTRVRSANGEEIVFSNKDLLESRIKNFKLLQERRVVQIFGVTYSTTPDKMRKIPAWIREITNAYKELRFERCHLSELAAYSINFELVIWVLSPDYTTHMDLKERLLLDIFNKFQTENIDFAFPTQTIFLQNEGAKNHI